MDTDTICLRQARVFFTVVSLALLIPDLGWSATQPGYAEQLYMDYCSVCHGERGDGNARARQGLEPPPRDFTQPGLVHRLPRERMIEIIRDGKPGTAMVGWSTQLNDTQIVRLTDFIIQRFMNKRGKIDPEPEQNGGSQNERGRQIYATSCSVCHGEEGKGAIWGRRSLNPPPVDFTAPDVKQKLDRERMIVSVTHGRPGSAMSAFGSQLSPQDISATVDYIRKEFMGLSSDSAPGSDARQANQPGKSVAANKSAPMPGGLVGDLDAGRAFYLQNCTACHGEAGDGKGPRAYFIFPKPRNFVDPGVRAAFNRPRLFAAIRDGVLGKEMPAWGKVLDEQTIAHITEYVFRTFIGPGVAKTTQDR